VPKNVTFIYQYRKNGFCTTSKRNVGRVTRKEVDPEPFPEMRGLSFPLRRNLERMGISSLTHIQKECIPAILSGSDVFGRGPPAR